MTLPQNTTTIEEFVEAGKGITITYFNLSFVDTMSNGTYISTHNVISDYITEISNACANVVLTEAQQFTYFYKPKLLCYDIYGNAELYFVLLLLNDMADVKEFTKSTIKMPSKANMSTILSYIYNAEKSAISTYNSNK